MKAPKIGYVIYQGPSQLDGKPIVCIGTLKSKNRKTGPMVQTWIIRSDIHPVAALTGADVSVCGECPHRPAIRKTAAVPASSCYVQVGKAPAAVYRAFKRGRYPTMPASAFAGRFLRIGSYGDPAAVPLTRWYAALKGTVGHTGYTHQWSTRPEYLALCMGSADSEGEAAAIRAVGGRYFRIRAAADPVHRGESICPAAAESKAGLTCDKCLSCGGASTGRRGSIVIVAH